MCLFSAMEHHMITADVKKDDVEKRAALKNAGYQISVLVLQRFFGRLYCQATRHISSQ
jgi:hypothetical protein